MTGTKTSSSRRYSSTIPSVLSVSSDFLDTAYQMATAAGSYAASGTASGEWMASIVTLKTS